MPTPTPADELQAGQWIQNPDNPEQYLLIISAGHCEELSAESQCDPNISITGQSSTAEFFQLTIPPKDTVQVYQEDEVPAPQHAGIQKAQDLDVSDSDSPDTAPPAVL